MIDVHCVCGKLYRVPEDKAGKKLQCRRCGAVQRIPRLKTPDAEAVRAGVIPSPANDDSGALALAPPVNRPPAGDDLRLLAEVRRCPSCGFSDDPSVVVCVRCGFDWRTQGRLQDAHEERDVSQRRSTLDALDQQEQALLGMAWWALTPLGLALGPWVIGQALGLESRLRAMGRPSRVAAQARQVGGVGLGMWLLIGVVTGVVLLRGDPARAGDVACRQRLGELGTAARTARQAGRLAPGGPLDKALTAAAARVPRECPVTHRPYILQPLTPPPGASGAWLLAWDAGSHPEPAGKAAWRAARLDGTVEEFASVETLQQAASERGGGQGSPAQPPPQPAGPGPGPAPPGPAPPPPPTALAKGEGLEAQVAAAREVQRELEEADPDLSQGILMSPGTFIERVTAPPEALIAALLKRDEPRERAVGAELAGRLDLPRTTSLNLVRMAANDRAPEVRFGVALTMRRVGEPAWLALMVGVAAIEGDSRLGQRAQGLIRAELTRDKEAARRVLREVAAQRRVLGVRGDGALVPFPPEALPQALELLGEKEVGREAVAVLFSAERAGLDLVLPLARSAPREQQLQAMATVDRFRAAGLVSLEEFLALLEALPDPEGQAEALGALAGAEGAPLPEIVARWVLKQLRAPPTKDALRRACERLAGRIGACEETPELRDQALAWMVDDLLLEGDPSGVLGELGNRAGDERVDGLLLARWERITREGREELRMALVKLARARPYDPAMLVLLEAAEDPAEQIRVAALQGLSEAVAARGAEVRRTGARVLASRLKGSEKSARVLDLVYQLAAGGLYCALGDETDRHRCSPALLRALQQQARKGEHRAIRCLMTHPSEEAVEALLAVVAELKELQQRMAACNALSELTGISSNSTDPAFWKQQLTPIPAKTKARLANAAAADKRRIKQLAEQAEVRMRELKKRGGR